MDFNNFSRPGFTMPDFSKLESMQNKTFHGMNIPDEASSPKPWETGEVEDDGPISHEAFLDAKFGIWDVALTPTKPVPHFWFGIFRNKKVLGLGCGGGQQMPIFTAQGARCTLIDNDDWQLEAEQEVAEREGYWIKTIKSSLDKPLPVEDGEFDIVFLPAITISIKDTKPLWKECYRVLKPGGILMAGLDNGLNFAFDGEEKFLENTLPFDPLANPEQKAQLGDDDMQFSHTLEEQLNGQLQAGFMLTHIFEDTNGDGNLHEHNIPTFMATRAVKPE